MKNDSSSEESTKTIDLNSPLEPGTEPAAEAVPKSTPAVEPTTEDVLNSTKAEVELDFQDEPSALPPPKLKELLLSSDTPSRFMTVLSLLFAILGVICLTLLITLYIKHKNAQKEHAPIEEKVEYVPAPMQSLGEIKVFAKNSMMEIRVEIVAECSNIETCEMLKAQTSQSRDQILPLLSQNTQEQWMNTDHKNILKKNIVDQLNTLKFPGKVIQVFFNDLSMEKGGE